MKREVNLGALTRDVRGLTFRERVRHGGRQLSTLFGARGGYLRRLDSANDREVLVWDPERQKAVPMLMFACNSYLGVTNHPLVAERVVQAVREWGTGLAGGPAVCGYTKLHAELEERLAAFKHAEDALLFPTGYQANVGMLTGLINPTDVILYDELSHASIVDGVRMSGVKAHRFLHNDVDDLGEAMSRDVREGRDVFAVVEGVYSMDGDIAPLDRIVPLCREHGAILMVDDAHGTAVLGDTGAGTSEHFGVSKDVDVTVTTFSKSFGVVGGAITGSRDLVAYLRYFASSYIFSTSLPPAMLASVVGALDVLEREPDRPKRLRENVDYLVQGLRRIGISIDAPSAIVILRAPRGMDLRETSRRFEDAGLYVGVVEYPAVPMNQQRFRISLMSNHTRQDLDRLLACIEELWEPWL
jgi:glycine C-acetyltransferase